MSNLGKKQRNAIEAFVLIFLALGSVLIFISVLKLYGYAFDSVATEGYLMMSIDTLQNIWALMVLGLVFLIGGFLYIIYFIQKVNG